MTTTMTPSLMRWHLSRDNQQRLAKFCEQYKTRTEQELQAHTDGKHSYFHLTFFFNNGGFIKAELLHGDTQGYSVADHFQVVDYSLGQ